MRTPSARRLGVLLTLFGGALGAFAQDSDPGSDGGATEAPWFVDVAAETGLVAFEGKRTKWVDVDGDGWLDVLLMAQDGRDWIDARLAEAGYPDGLPGTAPNQIVTRADWSGTAEQFIRFDLNRDGLVSEHEVERLARRHLWTLLRSQGGERFVDATRGSGLSARPVHLLVAGDIDDDGDLDLFASGYATQHPGNRVETPSFVYRNDGDGRFEVHDDAALGARLETVCAACFTDYDRDGRLDLFVGSWYRDFGNGLAAYPDRLFRGGGDGAFEDVTERVGLMLSGTPGDELLPEERRSIPAEKRALIGRRTHRPTYGVAAADWNGDGRPDLFGMSYGRQWNVHWRALPDGTFEEVGEATGFDGDAVRHGRYPEGSSRRAELPFRSNGNTFDCAFGDYDNDGDLDCVLSEYTHAWAGESSDVTEILRNTGASGGWAFERQTGALERVHEIASWNQGDFSVAWIDLENDGLLDLLVASSVYPDRNVLEVHRQAAPGRFERVTERIGIDWPDATQLSLADFDRDGDVDILIGNNPHPTRADTLPRRVALFRNDIANRSGHHFVSLELEGAGWREGGANRRAIGARVSVRCGELVQTREISGGRGHVGHQDDTRLVFGLGEAAVIDELVVRWPLVRDGKPVVQTFRDVSADAFYRLREGASELSAD